MKLEIVRFKGVLADRGVLLIDDAPFCCTLELPWKGNLKQVSCIPVGNYQAKKTLARKTNGGLLIPETLEVVDVPNRSGILFHVGNTPSETNGCILLGDSFGYIKGAPAVLGSKIAFASFVAAVREVKEAQLSIRYA
jgi:hypothetical protein